MVAWIGPALMWPAWVWPTLDQGCAGLGHLGQALGEGRIGGQALPLLLPQVQKGGGGIPKPRAKPPGRPRGALVWTGRGVVTILGRG